MREQCTQIAQMTAGKSLPTFSTFVEKVGLESRTVQVFDLAALSREFVKFASKLSSRPFLERNIRLGRDALPRVQAEQQLGPTMNWKFLSRTTLSIFIRVHLRSTFRW